MQGITLIPKRALKYAGCLLLAALDVFYFQGMFTALCFLALIPLCIVHVTCLFLAWIDAGRTEVFRKKLFRVIAPLMTFVVAGILFASVISSYVEKEFEAMSLILLEHKRAFGIPRKLAEVPQITQRWEVDDEHNIHILNRRILYMCYDSDQGLPEARLVWIHLPMLDRTIFNLNTEETFFMPD